MRKAVRDNGRIVSLSFLFILMFSLLVCCMRQDGDSSSPESIPQDIAQEPETSPHSGSFGPEETFSAVGNPVVIENTPFRAFDSLTIDGGSDDAVITACGVNLFHFMHDRKEIKRNGVTFRYDPESGSVTVSAYKVGKNTSSGEEMTVNGKQIEADFKFCFAEDTFVTASGNCSEPQGYDSPVFLQIVGPETPFRHDYGNGYTFLAKAGTEYGVRIMCRQNTTVDSLVFYPQLEIGTSRSSFSPYAGLAVKRSDTGHTYYPEYASEALRGAKHGLSWSVDPSLHQVAVYALNALKEECEIGTAGTLNRSGTTYLARFHFPKDTLVRLYDAGGFPHSDAVGFQVTDGNGVLIKSGNDVCFTAEGGREYGLCLVFPAGFRTNENTVSVIPALDTGLFALRSQEGRTTLFASDDSVIRVSLQGKSTEEKASYADAVLSRMDGAFGNRLSRPEENTVHRQAQITFIDDDTTSLKLVKRYHDILASCGVPGNYAVMTRRLDMDPALAETLLSYEEEGFGMLFHVEWQKGDSTNYFLNDEHRDLKKAEKNVVRGLRKMQSYGFSDYHYWVSPYGVNDPDMQSLAKRHGLECLISTGNNAFVSPSGNCSRYNIPRYGFSPSSDNTPYLKEAVDACLKDGGWMIVTTHVNSWGSSTAPDERLADLIRYALDRGMDVVSFPEGYQTHKALFYLEELS